MRPSPWITLAVLLLAPAGPRASSSAPPDSASMGGNDNVEVTLLAEHASIRPGEPFRVGLRMKLKNGWHTYWKQPGDAGLPLNVQWSLPPGFTAGPIEWPAPSRIVTGKLVSYGYERDVLLPVTITPPERIVETAVAIAGEFDWVECRDVCVAGAAVLRIVLPVRSGPPSPGDAARLFAEARARTPRPAGEGWRLTSTAGARAIELTVRHPREAKPRGAYFFTDQPLVVEHAEPQGLERVEGGFRLTMTPAANAAGPPSRLTGVLLLEGVSPERGNAIAVDAAVAPGDPAPAPAPASAAAWPRAAVYAILVAAAGIAGAWRLRRRASRS